MKHHRAIIALHWLMMLLILGVFAVALARWGMEDGDQRRFWLDVHRTIGLSVLALIGVRVGVRLIWGRDAPVAVPMPYKLASAVVQLFIYAGLVAIPLLGWAQSSARARHFKLFGSTMPSLAAHDPDRADWLGEWHETLAWTLAAIIAVHALAALYHHVVRKDGVLAAMLPGRWGRARLAEGGRSVR